MRLNSSDPNQFIVLRSFLVRRYFEENSWAFRVILHSFPSRHSFIVVVSIRFPHSHHHNPTVSSSRPHTHSPHFPATYSDSQTKVLVLRNTAAEASAGNLEVNSHSGGCASAVIHGLRGHLKPQFLEGVVEEQRCSEQQQEAYQKWCSTC